MGFVRTIIRKTGTLIGVRPAIGAAPTQNSIMVDFKEPIYVDPSHFIALVGKFVVGTATASQVISFVWQPIYSWE
jgi:hypothetical protein